MQSSKRNAFARLAVMVVLSATFIVIGYTQETKKKFTVNDLPAAVVASFQKEYPKATMKGAGKEKEHGVTYYEVESMDGTTKRDLLYTAEGKKVETEETIEMSSVPSEVKKTLSKEYPKGKVSKAEKVMKEPTTFYEFVVKQDDKSHEVKIDPKGKLIKKKNGEEKSEKDEDEEEEDEEKE